MTHHRLSLPVSVVTGVTSKGLHLPLVAVRASPGYACHMPRSPFGGSETGGRFFPAPRLPFDLTRNDGYAISQALSTRPHAL
jgi:hypothetical protein